MGLVHFNEKKNAYIVYNKGKEFSYSVNKYGPLANKLAKRSSLTGRRYKNYIKVENDTCIMKIYHAPTDTIYNVYFDLDEGEKISKYKWYINIPQNARTWYVASDKIGKLHRFILNIKDKNIIIDHIDKNGLNNKKDNLRMTTTSGNKRNMDAMVINNTSINGVSFSTDGGNPQYIVTWMEDKYRQRKKRFYIHRYNDKEECFKEAVKFRKKKEKEFNYLTN